jgi:hypothetical protein
LKCNTFDFLNKNIDSSLWSLLDQEPILSSQGCGSGKTSIPFEIRGNGIRIENGSVEGTGKLILLSKWPKKVAREDKV